MPLSSKLVSFWQTLVGKAHVEQELDEEMRSYIEMLTEEKVQAGVSREEARRAALIEFGGLDQVKERVRDVRVGVFLETLWQDLRYAARSLARSPGFAAVALLSLALGIGLNTAIFSTINAVLLRPLPYKDSQRLVRVQQAGLNHDNGTETGAPPGNYLDWKEQNTVFEAMAIYERLYGRFKMATEGNTAQIWGQRVSASFFPLLGVQPVLGRTFLDEEDKPGANVAVLSHGLWQRHFDSDPNVVGRDITLNQSSYRVIGVMPEGFRYFLEYGFTAEESPFRGGVDLWLTYPFETNSPTNRAFYTLSAIARLKPTSSLEQARIEMKLIGQRLAQAYPKDNKDTTVLLTPLHEAVVGQTRPSLRLVWGAVGLVLLIACANVANLLLARAAVRKHEITIRSAIGASRRRLVCQLLTESLLLALIGGAGGLVLAVAATNLLNGILPARVARFDEASLDLRVLIFALVATLATGVLFGLIPALYGSKVKISSALAQGGRGLRGPTGLRMQRILVVLQVGLSLVLLSAAGLMVNSFWRLHQIHLGFNPNNLLVFRCNRALVPPDFTELGLKENTSGGAKTPHVVLNPEAMRFPEDVVERLQALPGIESAAVGYTFPMVRTYGTSFKIKGRPEPSPQETEKMRAQEFPVSAGYFQTLGTRLLRGRDFSDRDTQNAPGIAIINQAMARAFWPEEANAMGNRIILLSYPEHTAEIVGIVEDERSWPWVPSRPHIYVPLSQSWLQSDTFPSFLLVKWRTVTFGIRTTSDPATLATAVRNSVKEVDKSQPVEWIRTMDEVISRQFEPWRATMLLFGLFAGLAVLLSAIGIYGVISYAVTERTHEIGVRMALGARPGDVLRMIMKGGFVVTLIGMLLGSIAAYWLMRLISSHLFEVKPTDPMTFFCVAVLLMGVAMLACYLPARRAARQDPTVALRCD